jgi:hypothetical protein
MKNLTENEIRHLLLNYERCELTITKALLIELKDRNLTIGAGVIDNILRFYNLNEIKDLYILDVDHNLINFELKPVLSKYINSNSEFNQALLIKIINNYTKEDFSNINKCLVEMSNRGKRINEIFAKKLIEHFNLKSEIDLYKVNEPVNLIELKEYHKKDFIKDARVILFIFLFFGFIEATFFTYISSYIIVGYSINIFFLDYLIKISYLKYINKYSGIKFGFILGIFSFSITTLLNIIFLHIN